MSVKAVIRSGKSRARKFISKHMKLSRIIAGVLAFAMIIGLAIFADPLVGYPLTAQIVKLKAKKYIKENYGEMGYVMESFKDYSHSGEYFAEAAIPGTLDSRFTVHCFKDGYMHDSYEYDVLELGSVGDRLNRQYDEFVNIVFESPLFPYKTIYLSSWLAVDTYYANTRYESRVPHDILVPDGLYDIRELGAIGGYLSVTVDTDELTPEKAAESLLVIDSLMKQGGVTYYAIGLSLEDLSVELHDRKNYGVYFRRSDIYEEGLVERVIQNHG